MNLTKKQIRSRLFGLANLYNLGNITQWDGVPKKYKETNYFYIGFDTEKENNLKYVFKSEEKF